jgi:outer membrane protein assembly factor BamD (BamD/ComL family)
MAQTKAAIPPVAKKAPRTLAGDVVIPVDDSRAQALALYESALRLMQEGKYEAAHTKFNQLLDGKPGDLADRIRIYINACAQQVSKGKTDFKSHEERYDYGPS